MKIDIVRTYEKDSESSIDDMPLSIYIDSEYISHGDCYHDNMFDYINGYVDGIKKVYELNSDNDFDLEDIKVERYRLQVKDAYEPPKKLSGTIVKKLEKESESDEG